MSAPPSAKAQARAALLGIWSYLLAGTLSAWSYPGGTHWEPSTTGFVWTNFWCDLLRPIALNGQPNDRGAWAARIALLALALGLGPFFALAHTRLELRRATVIALGTAAWGGRIALILVAAGTGRLSPMVHDWSILIGAPLGLLALVLVIALSGRVHRFLPLLGSTGLVLALWNLAQYAREALLGAPSWLGLPLVQKAATLVMTLFLGLFSWQAVVQRSSPAARS